MWARLERRRLESAVSMLEKGSVTASMAAEIAGMPYFDFEGVLMERGVRWRS